MAGKQVTIPSRPKPPSNADEFISSLTSQVPATPKAAKREQVRLTVDIPADVHRRMKVACAEQALSIADVVRELIETRFPG